MARFLSLDWDYQQLHVVSATLGRGGVRIQRAVLTKEELSPNPADAEALGRLLRERLKAAGIAPAPVLACVGRDRLILKDVRFPAVPPSEEPALVRFQAVKDLTDPADEVVIDYTPAAEPAPGGEQRALALIVRRELLTTYQTICKTAGLKLVAVAPRPFGMLPCLQQVVGTTVLTPPPEPPESTVAVVLVTERWAEFCIGRGDRLLLARSLAVGPNLAGEIRRNLSVYDGQNAQRPVRAVYLAGSGEHAALRERLQDSLEVPVYPLDPFAGDERAELPAANRGGFLGAVGLLHAWAARRGELPINFVRPKQPKPPRDPHRNRALVAACVAVLVLGGVVAACYHKLAEKDSQLENLYIQKSNLDRRLVEIEEDAKRIKALEDWAQTEVVWLDELYDLTDYFPDGNSIRLTALNCDPVTRGAKDKHVARMNLKGIFTTENYRAVDELMDKLVSERDYYRVDPKQVSVNQSIERFRFRQQFSTRVDVEKRPPTKYVLQLPAAEVEEKVAGKRNRQRQPNRGGMDFFGGEGP